MPKFPLSTDERRTALISRRDQKMAQSAHAFVRGSTARFYEWLATRRARLMIPSGPAIWICGDCHTGNLGPIADRAGKVEIQIRDFDQTIIGNPSHDLLRLALSLAMAARSSDLPGMTAVRMIEAMTQAYGTALRGQRRKVTPKDISPVFKVLKAARTRKWRQFAKETIEDHTPHIPLGSTFWPLLPGEKRGVLNLLQDPRNRDLLECVTGKPPDKSVEVFDAAYWVKGCSSLGNIRYAILAGTKNNLRILDIKEAVKAIAPRAAVGGIPQNNASRVVEGARHLSPFLGQRTFATSLNGKEVFVRELLPQDTKFDLSMISQDEAVLIATLFAEVIGRAHGRQLPSEDRRRWATELAKGHSKSLAAPSWLWKAVVALSAVHESSYLEHCRRVIG